jgi:CheY-like chemotaxis protein
MHYKSMSMLRRVLVVDDHRVVRKVFAACSRLVVSPFCGEAEDGRQKIEEAKRLRPDLIVLDFSMPVIDGLQAAKELKQIIPDVPIIL